MTSTFNLIQSRGAMTEADYPYAARDQSCRHNRSKVIGYIKEHGVSGKNNV